MAVAFFHCVMCRMNTFFHGNRKTAARRKVYPDHQGLSPTSSTTSNTHHGSLVPNATSNSSDSIAAPTVAVSPGVQGRLPSQISKEAIYRNVTENMVESGVL